MQPARSAQNGLPRSQVGIVIYALAIHQKLRWSRSASSTPLCLAFLDECLRLGAGGVQFPFRPGDAGHAPEFRRRADAHELFVESILDLPAGADELDEFDAQIRAAKSFGAELGRVVILPGRRYEQFPSFAEFKRAEAEGLERLRRAELVAARHRFRLAVENHKDQLIAEKLEILRQIDSEYVGLCVDVGNNFPLLEDPVDTARAFAPWALTVHIKDQAVRPSANGFLMADVPLGQGCLDLRSIVDLLRTAKPTLHFNYETITRDPLMVPVLTDAFWATLPDAPAHALARLMAILKRHSAPQPFPTVSQLSEPDQLKLELEGIQSSLNFARTQLSL